MLLRHLDVPDEIYCKMTEYIGTDNTAEVYEFILDGNLDSIQLNFVEQATEYHQPEFPEVGSPVDPPLIVWNVPFLLTKKAPLSISTAIPMTSPLEPLEPLYVPTILSFFSTLF